MLGLFEKKKVVLREERNTGDYRVLIAEIKDNGDLVFEGQDVGTDVARAFGCTEYEWCWTIKAPDIPKLRTALGGQGNILTLLEKQFSNEQAAGLYVFMQENHVPFESCSRVCD